MTQSGFGEFSAKNNKPILYCDIQIEILACNTEIQTAAKQRSLKYAHATLLSVENWLMQRSDTRKKYWNYAIKMPFIPRSNGRKPWLNWKTNLSKREEAVLQG